MSKHNPTLPVVAVRRAKSDGTLYAELRDGRIVPVDLCAYGAGPDAWLRDILFPCGTCKAWVPAGDLYGDGIPGDCNDCSDEYWCQRCGGHPDDCDGESCEEV